MTDPTAAPLAAAAADAPVVEIDPGRVRGFWRGVDGEPEASAAFLGIPFAQAPVGPLRFAAPVPPEPWDGVREAVEYGATAQRGDMGPTLIPEPSVPGESTLNVNVFTPLPGDRAAALPVLVYIHGGGYVAGSPASPWYDGRAFNRDGVVTVTISYRLGFDGFGHIAGAPSNRGVRDWLAALEWVQANISAFGGDPARVTIAGQSAGGGAVLTLLGMPTAQHLFHAVWALSPALSGVGAERARTLSAKLANLAGVAPTRDGFASVSEERLHSLQERAANPNPQNPMAGVHTILDEGLPWGPAIDGDLLPSSTMEAVRNGVGSDKPLVLGTTDDEFTMATDSARSKLRFVPVGLALGRLGLPREARRAYLSANGRQRRRGTAAMLGRYVTDHVFRSGVVRVAEARIGAGGAASTWAYRFSWASPTRTWALHCLDVPFWFDCLAAPGVTEIAGDSPPRSLAAELHGSAAAYVRDGDPGWTPWARGETRVFGGDPSTPELLADGYASVRPLV
ncbi:carboxylesterase family protein [Microbacterium sp. BK668]|uniref:carboxylesterase/lipase family protein n=1 Tax=Microbacterium sp. BK668 TaxID=2512118 RepID=UPI0010DBCD10|nr:carboxylesterase family protein [Microbacterium sp. BK668]TDN91433.1 para-nitrobenzyl esterase [Microbacterium sp. BK668]